MSCEQTLATLRLHILDAADRIRHIQARGDLTQDQVLYNAALRNLQTMSEATQQLPDTVAAIVDKHLKLWHALWVPCFTNADDLQPTVFRITVECPGQTGVEMEALTACSVALPKIYDM